MEISKACAFTGHRTLPYTELNHIRSLLDRAIRYAYDEGCRVFYNGGAIGFDTEAAERVILFRDEHPDIRLVLLLPCRNQDAKWSERQRASYQRICDRADEVYYLSEEYTDGCMRERNEMLVERSDILIAYLSHWRSGAAQTVSFAKKKGIPVYNLYNKN